MVLELGGLVDFGCMVSGLGGLGAVLGECVCVWAAWVRFWVNGLGSGRPGGEGGILGEWSWVWAAWRRFGVNGLGAGRLGGGFGWMVLSTPCAQPSAARERTATTVHAASLGY